MGKDFTSFVNTVSSQFYDAETSGTPASGIEAGRTMEPAEAAAVSESEPPDTITWEGLEQVRVFSVFN